MLNPYEAIGVRPIVNCRGTYTIITGSLTLPEVKRVMDQASRHFVQMDELMEAVGRRLAELTGAEFGIVTNGCAAAMTLATAASIAGCDPEKIQRLPDPRALPNEVVTPRYSRNEYDHAVRMLGVAMVEVDNKAELDAAFNERTAMVLILSCPAAQSGPLSVEAISKAAQSRGVPVLVDAAAERLTIPNIHLARGASMVAYSGGKCLRGPQSAGLLLGRKDLLEAAWRNGAPHHAFGRSLKAGKEEIMGMLAAVEMWNRRDHDAEWRQWERWLDVIGARALRIEGVRTEILQPADLSNHAPRLRIHWDGAALGITGKELESSLLAGNPRIAVNGSAGGPHDGAQSSLTIMPYMMNPGDAEIAAEAIGGLLASPPARAQPASAGPVADVAGHWMARMEFIASNVTHAFDLTQTGSAIAGVYTGTFASGTLWGEVSGNQVWFRVSIPLGGYALEYEFEGSASASLMTGVASLGEYGEARWTATPVLPSQ